MANLLFKSPRGVKDVLPEDQSYWQYIEKAVNRIVKLYGYGKLQLPVFEDTALYTRGVGETTDIVEKEMYTFKDKGGNSITLRPEFTAGVMRAYMQNGMASLPKPVKVWSFGPVFRYERPQAGRFRQHTQFNVEAIGVQDPALDLEVMSVAWQLYDELGFKDLNFQINSIGCPVCRPDFLDRLYDYYLKNESESCEECKKRIHKNPLRVLDCKNKKCQSLIEKSPNISSTLCPECKEHFDTLIGYLENLKRPYTINHRLVRGLDYYTKTVFEVWAQGIGAQNAVCGGGRYDGLAEILGGKPTPAVGFASGIERIVLTLKHLGITITDAEKIDVYFAYLGKKGKIKVVELLSEFRKRGCRAVMGFASRSLKAQLREANKLNAVYSVIIGDDEVEQNRAQVKNMRTSGQEFISFEKLPGILAPGEKISE